MRIVDALYSLPIREIECATMALIREFVGDRTLFILAENLEEIFRGLGPQGQWAFRSFLSERPFATILATTPSLFAGISERESAFYGFFNQTYLEELNVVEAAELLQKIAERRDDTTLSEFLKTPTAKDRVQAVHDLAGGHPRIYLLFAHLLTQETLDELVTPFLSLLDELTPYYQSRMQLLSPQQRKIVEYLCGARGAIPVKQIAAQNLMTSQTASSQLDKLEEMAYLRKTVVGRQSFYELREPLLRLVIEVKRGRGEPVRLIVDFLRRWYDRSVRKEKLSGVTSNHPLTRQYLLASLDLDLAISDLPDLGRALEFCTELERCLIDKDYARACEVAEEVIERKGTACRDVDWEQYALCLYVSRKFERAKDICTRRFGLQSDVTKALLLKANSYFARDDDFANCAGCLDELTSIFPTDNMLWQLRGFAYLTLYDYAVAANCFRMAESVTSPNELSKDMKSRNSIWQTLVEVVDQDFDILSDQEAVLQYFRVLFGLALVHAHDVPEYPVHLFVNSFAKHQATGKLADIFTDFISELLRPTVTLQLVRDWLVTWHNATVEYPEFEIPLRILAVAIEWKKSQDERVLLGLAIEERRIVERLIASVAELDGGAQPETPQEE